MENYIYEQRLFDENNLVGEEIRRILWKGQWHGGLIFVICAWINGWVNNREAGDLRRHRASYDVIVISREPVVTYVSEKLHWLPAHNYIYVRFLDGLISTWLHGWTLSSVILDLCNMDFKKWFDKIPIKRLLGKESYGIIL